MKFVKVALIVLLIAGVVIGVYFTYNKIKTLNSRIQVNDETISTLELEITDLQNELNDARTTIKVYRVGDFSSQIINGTKETLIKNGSDEEPIKEYSVRAGAALKMSMLETVEINKANYLDCFITEDEIEEYLGRVFKTEVKSGTVLLKQMFRDKDVYEQKIYQLDIVPPYLPVGLREGDLIDVNIVIPQAHIFKVLSHREVVKITDGVVTIYASPADEILMQQVYADVAIYSSSGRKSGARWYILKYIEDNEDQIPFYPVSTSMEPLVKLNPNIKDTTRLINPSVRRYIEYLFSLEDYTKVQEEENAAIQSYQSGKDAAVQGAYDSDLQSEMGETDETVTQDNILSDDGESSLFDGMGG